MAKGDAFPTLTIKEHVTTKNIEKTSARARSFIFSIPHGNYA
jgi:hypothetical protein